MPGNWSARYGRRENEIDSEARSATLQGDLRALYEMYRSGEVPERVIRLVYQLEDAYWEARLAESAETETADDGASTACENSN